MEKFRQLVLENLPGLMRYATALTGNYQNAEDLMAICLNSAIKQAEHRDTDISLKYWLLAIIHKVYMEPENGFRGQQKADHDSKLNSESKFDKLALQKLQAALQEFPPIQKEVFILITLEEVPYKDVKFITGLSLTKIMALLHQSRKKLRQLSFPGSEISKAAS